MKRIKFNSDWSVTKKVPSPEEQVSGEYVKWGKKNEYPQFLNRLADESSMHANLLNSKVNYITSGGLKFEGQDEIEFASLQNNVNGEYKLQELYEYIANDAERYNGYAILLCFALDGSFSYFEPIGFDELRTNEDYSRFWWSPNWENTSIDPKEYPAFDPDNPQGKMILYYTGDTKGYDKRDYGIYPKPKYSGGIPAMMTEAEINYFGFYEVINGFKSGTHIHFRDGRPENEEDENNVRDEIQAGGTNRDGAGSLLVTFGDEDVSVSSLVGNDLPDRYANQYEQVTKSILYSHSITTPALFGVQTPGSLGNSNELQVGFAAFVEGYVKSAHNFLRTGLERLLQVANVSGDLELRLPQSPLSIKDTDSLIEKVAKSPSVLAQKLVEGLEAEEIRELYGMTQQEEEEKEVNIAAKLGTISPLVATKVLETMSVDEVRSIVGLPNVEGGDEVRTPRGEEPVRQDKDTKDPILSELEKVGRPLGDSKVIAERDLPSVFNSEELDAFELELKSSKFVDGREAGVLAGLENGDSIRQIARSLGVTQREVRQLIDKLTDEGFIDSDGNVTPEGLNEIEINETTYSIVYQYQKTPGVDGPPVLANGRTRPFCESLINMNRVYTRTEIDQIGARVGRDVWTYRGGWWNDNGVNKPFCRHSWKQILIVD